MKEITQGLIQELTQNEAVQDCYAPEVLNNPKENTLTNSIQLSGHIIQKGKKWAVYLFFFCQGPVCRFYKKCLNRQCRSEAEARIVLEYGKNVERINNPDQEIESVNINWN